MLCFVTVFAFIAAYEAARKAGEALEISANALALETDMLLDISVCSNEKQHDAPRVTYYVEEEPQADGTIRYSLEEAPPAGRTYVPVIFEFENLGRIAILDLTVDLRIVGEPTPFKAYIGSIGKERSVHVAIAFEWKNIQTVGPPKFAWASASGGTQSLDYTEPPPMTLHREATSQATEPYVEAPKKWVVTFDRGRRRDLEPSPNKESPA
jgi:hypothetical protein